MVISFELMQPHRVRSATDDCMRRPDRHTGPASPPSLRKTVFLLPHRAPASPPATLSFRKCPVPFPVGAHTPLCPHPDHHTDQSGSFTDSLRGYLKSRLVITEDHGHRRWGRDVQIQGWAWPSHGPLLWGSRGRLWTKWKPFRRIRMSVCAGACVYRFPRAPGTGDHSPSCQGLPVVSGSKFLHPLCGPARCVLLEKARECPKDFMDMCPGAL